MLIYELKLDGTTAQYARIDEAIRVAQFVRNKCLRMWMDGWGITANDLQASCAELAKAFPFAACLNSQARQVAADRAWSAISRFYTACQEHRPGKKGYPRFRHDVRSVEYKQTGWKLDPDGKHLTLTDGCGIGRVRLIGSRALTTFPLAQIKRVRLRRRADGYYAQFAIHAERRVEHVLTGKRIGLDMGLTKFATDSEGEGIPNPRYLRRSEQRLRLCSKRLSRKSVQHKRGKKPKDNHAARHRAQHNKYPRQVPTLAPIQVSTQGHHPTLTPLVSTSSHTPMGVASSPQPTAPQSLQRPLDSATPATRTPAAKPVQQSQNWQRARRDLARQHLTVQRQREDFARKKANTLVSSHDLIALENLQVRNLVKNRRLAKSISDAGWARFRHWLEYYGSLHRIPVIAVAPEYTSQDCSVCGELVTKSLSVRTHICPRCGTVLDRDHNAARNILQKALEWMDQHARRETPVSEVTGRSSASPPKGHVQGNPQRVDGTVGHTET
jgi:IS605 OrfB family transposase